MYDTDPTLMQQLTLMRGEDLLREAEEERRLAIARKARVRRSWGRVARETRSTVLIGVRSWFENGQAAGRLDHMLTRTNSR